ncbi:unnamed protein product [Closterium sp. NIES-54]
MIAHESLSCQQQHRRHQHRHHQHRRQHHQAVATESNACSSLELPQRVSRTHPTNEQAYAPVPTPTAVAATFTAPPASPAFTQPLLEFPLPAVEFSLRELAACTRGFSPDAMLAMDWAGAVYRGCCHVGKGHVGGEGPHLEGPSKEAPRDSAKRAQSPADQCCCATCQELTATECVTLRGGCARVKRWRYLPSSLSPPPSTSAAAEAIGSRSTSSEQGPTASDSMPSHTPEQAQISGEVDSSVSAGREMMGRLAAAAASHMNLLPIVGFSCSEELLLVFRSNPSARSLEYALARGRIFHAMLCGAGSPSALSSWSARLSIARQIAGGLDHLHSHSFLHASLRPANVLLHAVGSTQRCSPQSPSHLSDREQRWWRHMLRRKARAESAAQVRVQLADYGMPCQARGRQGSEGKGLGCVVFGDAKYLDPAFMGSGRYGTASDVYALGVIMNELILRTGSSGKKSVWPITSARASDSSSKTAATAAAAAATAAVARAFPVSRSFPGPHVSPAEPEPDTVTQAGSAAPAGAPPAETAAAAGAGGEPSRTRVVENPSPADTSSTADPSLSHLAVRFGPVRYHQASALVQWCTERNPAHRPSCLEVEQLVKGMEGMNVMGELRQREMNGRRLRGRQWAMLK